MKTRLIIVLILLWTISCKPTKFITKFSNDHIVEEYYVSRSNKKEKTGDYTSYYIVSGNKTPRKYIKEKGSYKTGLKDSLWVEFYTPKKKRNNSGLIYGSIKTQGYYKEGKKVGVWDVNKKETTNRYNHDTKERLEPLVKTAIAYPQSAMEAGIQGEVSVKFQTNCDCTISNIKVLKSLTNDCNNAVIEAIKELSRLKIKHGIACEIKIDTLDVKFIME